MKILNNYFASANTSKGFVNEFTSINNPKKKAFMYIIKGGSGTGKSTLMKKVGEHFFLLGYEIEYFYCSSDKDSLDGVRIAQENIAIVDGTAPHVTEANLPGVDSKIINVGKHILDDVGKYENELRELVAVKKEHFVNMYSLLNGAGALHNVKINKLKQISTQHDVEKIANELLVANEITDKNTEGYVRKLFCEAIDKGGLFTLITKDFDNVVKLNYNEYVSHKVLDLLVKTLGNYGYEVIQFCCILNNELVSSVYIPEREILIRLDDEANCQDNEVVQECNSVINKLLSMAGSELNSARELHMKIEKCYIENVDFEGLNKMTAELIDEIDTRLTK